MEEDFRKKLKDFDDVFSLIDDMIRHLDDMMKTVEQKEKKTGSPADEAPKKKPVNSPKLKM